MGLARQLGAVQEKQQRDGQVGHPAESHGGLAAGGQQGRKEHSGNQGQGEIVGQKTRASHKQDLPGLPRTSSRL